MKIEANLDRSGLIQRIESAYSLGIRELEFFPTGWLAYCYVVQCQNGERYFLKIYAEQSAPSFAASSRDFYLPLTAELHAKGILAHVPYPLENQEGVFLTAFGDYALILTPFIAGKVVGFDGMDAAVLGKLARSVGILHHSLPLLDIAHPHVETFEIVFESLVREALERLAGDASVQSSAMRKLSERLSPRKAQVLAYLARLKELQGVAQAKTALKVVCHTDLHGENLILGENGELYILDWENALIAPREHDLFTFAGDTGFWEVFLPDYEQVAGAIHLDGDLLRFYYYRRGLEDIADWIAQIMSGQGTDDDHHNALEDIANILEGLGQVERTVDEIIARDRARHTKAT